MPADDLAPAELERLAERYAAEREARAALLGVARWTR